MSIGPRWHFGVGRVVIIVISISLGLLSRNGARKDSGSAGSHGWLQIPIRKKEEQIPGKFPSCRSGSRRIVVDGWRSDMIL